MAVTYPQIGNKVIAKIIDVKGDCTIGMQVGDEFELSTHKCGEFCGFFYHNIFGLVQILQCGGTFPGFENPDVMEWACPHSCAVKVELRRIKE